MIADWVNTVLVFADHLAGRYFVASIREGGRSERRLGLQGPRELYEETRESFHAAGQISVPRRCRRRWWRPGSEGASPTGVGAGVTARISKCWPERWRRWVSLQRRCGAFARCVAGDQRESRGSVDDLARFTPTYQKVISVISLQARVQCLSPGDATIFSNVHARQEGKRASGD